MSPAARRWAVGFGAIVAGLLALLPGVPPLLALVLAGPLLYAVPGQPLAALLGLPDRLGRAVAGVWISLGLLWLEVGLLREVGVGLLGLDPGFWPAGLVGSSALLWLGGAALRHRRGDPAAGAPTQGAGLGLLGVGLGLLWVIFARGGDLLRPLERGWYHPTAESAGAVDPSGPNPEDRVLNVIPDPNGPWRAEAMGWPGSGAQRLSGPAGGGALRLVAPEGAEGTVFVAMRGAEGQTLRLQEADGEPITAEVRRAPVEDPEEGPVARYRDRGVAALPIPLSLKPGGAVDLRLDGETAYLLTGPEAVWSLHAVGELRYTHYYQLLNQVENLDWAAEVLVDRRLVWNQPPGWTPLLAAAGALGGLDLDTAGLLFLGVLALLGAQSVTALLALSPRPPGLALLLPGALVAAHGLLMLEPGSHDFPDSLYAAAMLGVVAALARGEPRAWALMALTAQALRWPGLVFSLILLGSFAIRAADGPRAALARARPGLQLAGLGLGLMVLLTLLAVQTGDAEDLLFVLYFETFPEHWHGETAPLTLISRVPEFYALWARYTGGGAALLLLAAWGRGGARRQASAVALGALLYSALLATIDHHPTHYFLPLVALTGPGLGAAAADRPRLVGTLLAGLCLAGVAVFLWTGQV